jgi:hypothetical protein
VNHPDLSVGAVFFNMRREAQQTLFSIASRYQRGVEDFDYEVIAADSGSSEALDGAWVESRQENFRFIFVEPPWPSQAVVMNEAFGRRGPMLRLVPSYGVRILLPGILPGMSLLGRTMEMPFIDTHGMPLGRDSWKN